MSASAGLRFRTAAAHDVQAIASLHADSWRRHYRGAYSDAFLDGDVTGYLAAMWTTRLASQDAQSSTILAEADGAIVGTRLMALTARAVLDWSPASGLYLWVLEQNVAAQSFYEARGGACVERAEDPPPGGDPANLNGQPMMLRYAWQDPSRLLG